MSSRSNCIATGRGVVLCSHIVDKIHKCSPSELSYRWVLLTSFPLVPHSPPNLCVPTFSIRIYRSCATPLCLFRFNPHFPVMHASKHGLQRNARVTAVAAIGGYFTNSTLAHWQLFEREAFLVLRLQPEFMLLTTGGWSLPCRGLFRFTAGLVRWERLMHAQRKWKTKRAATTAFRILQNNHGTFQFHATNFLRN